jgi:hypothetical protein
MKTASKETFMNRIAFHCTLTLALAVTASTGWAAGKSKVSEAQAAYQQERARCLRGESNQARATCLKEAGAAYEEARRGSLGKTPAAELASNATQRCNAQPASDRESCMQRILGAGKTEGSVGGGGLLRETETKSR